MTIATPGDEPTLLFTDIEGSTQLAQTLSGTWPEILRQHRELSRTVWREHGGIEVDTAGDGFFVAFDDAATGVAAAVRAQRALCETAWPCDASGTPAAVRIRMGLHRGRVTPYDGGYVGYEVHRAARITAAAHGGQVLASAAVVDGLVVPGEPDLRCVDLGHHRLKDIPHPEQLFQIVAPGLPQGFPPVRTLPESPGAGSLQVPPTLRNGVDVLPGLLLLPGGGQRTLTSYGLRIGRSPDNDLVLADPAVSRHHCAITATDGGFVLTDLQSTHGTRVDGRLVAAPELLADGVVLRLGDSELRFRWPAP